MINVKNSVGLHSWKAEHVRLSLFSNGTWPGNAGEIFRNIFKIEPESIVQKPAAGESIATGAVDHFAYEVRHAFNRVDVFLKAISTDIPSFPLLEDIEGSMHLLASSASLIFKDNENIIRVAIGANGMLEVLTPSDAYKKLSFFTGLRLDYDIHRDVNFQINTPTKSSIDSELTINQMTVWNCPTFSVVSLNAPPVSFPSRSYFCGCLTDLNTDGDRRTTLNVNSLEKILDELIAKAADIYRTGLVV